DLVEPDISRLHGLIENVESGRTHMPPPRGRSPRCLKLEKGWCRKARFFTKRRAPAMVSVCRSRRTIPACFTAGRNADPALDRAEPRPLFCRRAAPSVGLALHRTEPPYS